MSEPTTPSARVERVPTDGADLHVETRGAGPTLLLHGAPMDARAFEGLAAELSADHTVVTLDPRGIARSTVDDAEAPVAPATRADDIARVLTALDLAPAVVVGSSGGAVSALALAVSRPELITGVVAHEPPVALLLDDHAQVRADTERMIATYVAGDRVGYWRQFLGSAGIDMPEEMFQQFFAATPEGRDAEDERFAVERMELATTFWEPPLDRLSAMRTRIVVGIGEESAGQLCDRTSRALATRLDLEPVVFPGDHIGFVAHPEAFAATLRNTVASIGSPAPPS